MAKQQNGSKTGHGLDSDKSFDQSVSTITTKSEAYYNVFNILKKRHQHADAEKNRPGANGDDVLLNRLNLADLPSPIRIMDFGGGTGEPLVPIFKKMADLNKKVIVSVEEPYKEYLEKYKLLLENTSNTSLDIAYTGLLQNYFGKSVEDLMAMGAYPQHLQDRVIALHLLYHVVHFFNRTSDPFKILQDAVSAMYAILKPGGEVVILLNQDPFFKAIRLHCYEILFPNWVDNLKRIHEAFESVIFSGGIVDTLNALYPNYTATVRRDEIDVPLAFSTLAEVGAAVSITCMNGFPDDDTPFDQRMLDVCTDFVTKSGPENGLSKGNDGMYHLSLRCIYVTIKKV